MMDAYRNADPRYRPYMERARAIRARAFARALKRAARCAWNVLTAPARLLACRRKRWAAERELLALDERMLKDIGLSRSQIGAAVVAHLPPDCGGRRDIAA